MPARMALSIRGVGGGETYTEFVILDNIIVRM